MIPVQQPSSIKSLPPEYNPNMDQGWAAKELFSDWHIYPDSVWVRRNDEGENIVIAFGGQQFSI